MSSNDRYDGMGDDLLSPASDGAVVAPSDTLNLPTASKRLWIGGTVFPCNVALVTVKGTALSYTGIPNGMYLNVRAAQVKATGTTATSIVAEY